jgi:molybdopterin converting factor small subunit
MAKVTFYAAARAAAGETKAEIAAHSLEELVGQLKNTYPKLGAILPGCTYLKNGVACRDIATPLESNDGIDVLPRFAGG